MTPSEIREQIEALTAKNQALGAQIDAIREERRGLVAKVDQLNKTLVLMGSLAGGMPRDASVPGATVEVSAEEVLRGMLAAVTKQ